MGDLVYRDLKHAYIKLLGASNIIGKQYIVVVFQRKFDSELLPDQAFWIFAWRFIEPRLGNRSSQHSTLLGSREHEKCQRLVNKK
jgi:hypothetical protein